MRFDAVDFLVPIAAVEPDPALSGRVRFLGYRAVALGRLAADPGLRARLGDAGVRRALDLYVDEKIIERQILSLGL